MFSSKTRRMEVSIDIRVMKTGSGLNPAEPVEDVLEMSVPVSRRAVGLFCFETNDILIG